MLTPVLYCAQELTLRIGLSRGMGLAAVLRKDFGSMAAWFVAAPLLLTCVGAVVSEMSMIMEVLAWWGVPCFVTNTIVCLILLSLSFSGSHEISEKVGLAMGLCQVTFFATMFIAGPKTEDVIADLQTFPVGEGNFSAMVTANIGAVIMPWMLAYQQSSMVHKGLAKLDNDEDEAGEDLGETLMLQRLDTAFGSILTQGVMIAMLISVAAVVPAGSKVGHVSKLCVIFTSILGSELTARIVLSFGIVGACMVAAIVVSNCAAWTVEEALGRGEFAYNGSIRAMVAARPAFYASYLTILAFSFVSTMAMQSIIVKLNIFIEALNGFLMPPVIFALWYVACYNIPKQVRLGSWTRWPLFVVFFLCSALCLCSIFSG